MKGFRLFLIVSLFVVFACLLYSQNIRPYARITDFWTRDEVVLNERKGLELHLSLDIYNHGSFEAHARFLFYLEDGSILKDFNGEYVTLDGQVTVEQTFTPNTAEENYEIVVFMPYEELHVKGAKGNLKCLGLIYDYDNKQIAVSDYLTFFVDGSL